MKRNHLNIKSPRIAAVGLFFCAAALALLAGCARGDGLPSDLEEEGRAFTITATLEQPSDTDGTKTSLGALNVTNWCSGDKIILFSGENYATASVLTTSSTSTTGEFTLDGGEADPAATGAIYAFYPYTAVTAPAIDSDGKITATLGNQFYTSGSFGANSVPMMAYSADRSGLSFKNVFSILKIQLSQAANISVSAIRVTSKASDEYLSGKVAITYNSGQPTVSFDDADNRSTSVTLKCTAPVSLGSTAKTFYIALPPTPAAATSYGYDIEVFTSDGKKMTKSMPCRVENKLLRSRIKQMEAVSFVADPINYAPANCYIVAPNTDGFTFQANIKGNSTEEIPTKIVKLLWNTGTTLDDVIENSSVSYDETTKLVTLNTTGAGNAVVAAYAAGGTTILWSWHIWVTDYNPDDENNTYGQRQEHQTGVFLMDRSLGAMDAVQGNNINAYGLLYQWGRKDPFIGASATTLGNGSASFAPTTAAVGAWGTITIGSALSGGTSLDYSIKNPMTYIFNASSPYDWYGTSTHNDYLWNEQTTDAKTIYDPCPAGWRVPANGTWTGLTSAWISYGRKFTVLNSAVAWYPAAGYRYYSDGLLYYVGTGGYYWSCSTSSTSAYNLYFSSSNVGPSYANYRSYGFSVRCRQE